MSDPNETISSRAQWRDRRPDHRHERGPVGGAIAGLVILVIGAVLLAENFGYHLPERWWAALLLIPAAGSLVSAIRFWRQDNRMSARVTGSIAGGLIFLVLACAFFFGLTWNFLWPAVLMLIGAGLMARSYWPK